MKMRIILSAVTAIALTAVALVALARSSEIVVGDIAVTLAWARATPPGATVGAAYVTAENRGDSDDRLLGVTSVGAASVSMHETVEQDGVARMRPLVAATIAPGGVLAMQPGGAHLMLAGLAGPLKEGGSLMLTLVFEKAGALEVVANIAGLGAEAPDEGHAGHEM